MRTAESNLGKWDKWYSVLTEEQPYGDTATYAMGAEWLSDCATVEDWGCGKGWFSKFYRGSNYVGIDGSASPFATVVADLEVYTSSVEGIFMRHVIEHNYNWAKVLDNALSSFTKKMALVLFTPLIEETKEIAFVSLVGVPDMAFSEADLAAHIEKAGATYRLESLPGSMTDYEVEHVFYIEKAQ